MKTISIGMPNGLDTRMPASCCIYFGPENPLNSRLPANLSILREKNRAQLKIMQVEKRAIPNHNPTQSKSQEPRGSTAAATFISREQQRVPDFSVSESKK